MTDEQIEHLASGMVARDELIWLGFRKDAHGRYTIPVIEKSTGKLIRACIAQASAPATVTDAMAITFHRATTDGGLGIADRETIKCGLRAVLAGAGSGGSDSPPEPEDTNGYALAMRVLQSDLYLKLDGRERAECDGFCAAGQGRALSTSTAKHDSDCALHNEPAYPAGPCDCRLSTSTAGAEQPSQQRLLELAKVHCSLLASPHHITFTLDGLKRLIAELRAPQQPAPVEVKP